MNEFDKSVNFLLENLIFEQDQSEIDPESIIMDTRKEVDSDFKTDPQKSSSESQQKYDDESVFSDFSNQMSNYLESQIKGESQVQNEQDESSWLERGWEGAKELGKEALHKGEELYKTYVEPSFEEFISGAGEFASNLIGKKYKEDIQNQLSEEMWYKIASLFDPTGISSWPYLNTAVELYKQNKGGEHEDAYFLNLLAAAISVVPGTHLPLSILTLPFKILTLPAKIAGGTFLKFLGKGAASTSKSMAAELRALIQSDSRLLKASGKIDSALAKAEGKASKGILAKSADFLKTATRAVIKTAERVGAKTASTAGKAASTAAKATALTARGLTDISGGDIPEKMKEWSKAGETRLKDLAPRERTLGKFPSFSQLSTQRF